MFRPMSLMVFALLFLTAACVPEKFGQERIDQLCGSRCVTAVTSAETPFQPDTNASSLKNHCGIITGNQTLPAGLTVNVATVMPEGFYGDAALIGFVDENGVAHVGWVDEDNLQDWSPYEMYGLVDHCSTP